MLKIGITGGIGSGKSTVCMVFEVLGIPVFSADDAAKQLMITDKMLMQNISALFGEDAYINGDLNRKLISEKVFNNRTLLDQLNAIVHPVTFAAFDSWLLKQHSPYIIKEAAILFESGAHLRNDLNILVYANEETRIRRVMQRDHFSREQVLARMKNQMSEEEKKELSDFVIYNEDDSMIIPQVLDLHQQFIARAQ
jgi:dephospho-CoA kinase